LGVTQEIGEPSEPQIEIVTPALLPTVTLIPTEVAEPEAFSPTLEIILGPAQEVGVLTEGDINAAAEVMMTRLSAAGIRFNLLTDYGAEEMTLLVDAPSEQIVPLLTTVGFLELVDFSGLDETPQAGDCILTSAQQQRYEHQRICLNLETGEEPLTAPDGSPFETVITGDGVISAEASLDAGQVGAWQVHITLDDDASDTLGDFTEAHLGQPMALVLDGEVIIAPSVQSPIVGQFSIMGNFSASEAQDVARILNSHALPFSVQMIGIDSLP
jgi:hypothetical protein